MKTTLYYVVSWCLVYFQPAPCPEHTKNNELGIKSPVQVTTADYCEVKVRDCNHKRIFFDKDSAMNFFARNANAPELDWMSIVECKQKDSIVKQKKSLKKYDPH